MKKRISGLSIILFVVILIGSCFTVAKFTKISSKYVNSYVPTVVLHGSPTVKNSLLPIIKRIQSDIHGNHNLTLIVDEDGKVHVEGAYQKVRDPLIQIMFENNDSTEYNQVQWLANCLKFLKKNYGINEINFIGHSIGGVDIMLYLARYEPKNRSKVPRINKIVTLGAPYNGENMKWNSNYQKILKYGPKKTNETYQIIEESIKEHPLNVRSWLNIAGDIHGDGIWDNTVPIGSVASITPLMEKEHIDYQFKIVKYVGHSGLHNSRKVDKLVEQFIWGK